MAKGNSAIKTLYWKGKIFTHLMSDKGLVIKVYTEYSKLNNNNSNNNYDDDDDKESHPKMKKSWKGISERKHTDNQIEHESSSSVYKVRKGKK